MICLTRLPSGKIKVEVFRESKIKVFEVSASYDLNQLKEVI